MQHHNQVCNLCFHMYSELYAWYFLLYLQCQRPCMVISSYDLFEYVCSVSGGDYYEVAQGNDKVMQSMSAPVGKKRKCMVATLDRATLL